MRVLQVTPHYFPETKFGGPPVKIHGLCRGLAARGVEVRVVTFHSERRRECREVLVEGIWVQYLPWVGWGTRQVPLGFARLRELVAEADVVHCYGLYNLICPLAARMARGASKPVVIEPLGMYQPRARSVFFKRLYNSIFTERMFREAACVVAAAETERREIGDGRWETTDHGQRTTQGEKADILKADTLKAEKLKTERLKSEIVVRRNGIEVDQFSGCRLKREEWGGKFRARIGIGSEERVVLFLGRISPIKNLEQLIQAWALVKAETLTSETAKAETLKAEKLKSETAKTEKLKAEGPKGEGLKTEKLKEVGGWTLVLAGPEEGGYAEKLKAETLKLGLRTSETNAEKLKTERLTSGAGEMGDGRWEIAEHPQAEKLKAETLKLGGPEGERLNAEGRKADVIFAGGLYGEGKLEALAAADLFVLPSVSESFGNAAAEAVAAGVPVLLTDACGIAPMIHGRAGLAVGLGVESLAQGLRVMLEDEGRRRELTARREEVVRELSWEEPVGEMVAIYRKLKS